MFLSRAPLVLLTSLTAVTTAFRHHSTNTSDYNSSCIIKRDVVVIGGGSSGTYAAIGLKDRNKTVAVVEAQGLLGGHTNTYTDPATKQTWDYGVVVFDNTTIVKNYFARFNVPVTANPSTANAAPGLQEYYVDFRTGENDTNYAPADPTTAFANYAAQLLKYPFLNTPGWNLPDPVPEDLLIPFRDFVTKYDLGPAVPLIASYSQGFGDFLGTTTVYVLHYFGLSVLQGAQSSFLTTARRDNSELYERARADLGDSVFLNSKVIRTARSDHGVRVVITTPQGPKLILAKKIISSIPPLLSNLAGFDLTSTERGLFAQFSTNAYYTGILNNTGIPDNAVVTGVGADTEYNLPADPTLYGIDPTSILGLKDIKFGAASAFPSDQAARSAILADLERFTTANEIFTSANSNATFVAYSNHTPYELRVSVDQLRGGFYARLNGLQGVKSTYWTGAAFDRHDSGDLWAFTEGLLGRVAA